jgi:hypothetical protein
MRTTYPFSLWRGDTRIGDVRFDRDIGRGVEVDELRRRGRHRRLRSVIE